MKSEESEDTSAPSSPVLLSVKKAINELQRDGIFEIPLNFIPWEDSLVPIDHSTIGTIFLELGRNADSIANDTEFILTSAVTLFVLFIYTNHEREILSIVTAGWSDKLLPTPVESNDPDPLSLHISGWTPKARDAFEARQWLFLPPRFRTLGEHVDLQDRCILPFVQCHVLKDINNEKAIYNVKIHRQYQTIYHPNSEPEPSIAIKRFSSNASTNFWHERKVLCQLSHLKEEHISPILASYTHRGEYFIMSPLAVSDLAEYWMQKDPIRDMEEYVRWFIREITGVMGAFCKMHNMSNPQNPTSTSKPEGIFHGDIKPGNILVMEDKRLVLNDFGLSAWTNDPSSFETTRTYEAPESQLNKPVGPSSDIWSFGCVIFEGLIWLLHGYDAVQNFSQQRIMATEGLGLPFKDDHFFMLRYEDRKPVGAKIRETVEKYSEGIREHERCVGAVKELLDIVMENMLVVNHNERGIASDIVSKYQGILDRQDEKYSCKDGRNT